MPGLTRFVDEVEVPIRLALSLHAADPRLRSKLMPVNDRYPLEDVLDGVPPLRRAAPPPCLCRVRDARRRERRAGPGQRARPPARADEFKVNLIPYNPTGRFDGSSREAIERFRAELQRARVPATVRLTRGRDIAAACGQLAADPRRRPAVAASAPTG